MYKTKVYILYIYNLKIGQLYNDVSFIGQWFSDLFEPTSVAVHAHVLFVVSGTYWSEQASRRRRRMSSVRAWVSAITARVRWSTAQHVHRRTGRSKCSLPVSSL